MNNKKQKIFDVAIQLFAEKGYERTTVDEIASNAGLAKGTIYYYFKSKDELFNFLAEEGVKALNENIDKKINEIDNPIQKLKQLIIIQSEIIVKYNKFITILLSQLWGHEERQIKFRTHIQTYINEIKKIIDECIEKELIINKDSNVIAAGIFGVISSTMIHKMLNEQDFDLDETYNLLTKYILEGIQFRK